MTIRAKMKTAKRLYLIQGRYTLGLDIYVLLYANGIVLSYKYCYDALKDNVIINPSDLFTDYIYCKFLNYLYPSLFHGKEGKEQFGEMCNIILDF